MMVSLPKEMFCDECISKIYADIYSKLLYFISFLLGKAGQFNYIVNAVEKNNSILENSFFYNQN